MNKKEKKITEIIIAVFAVGVVGLSIPYTRPWFQILVPLNLLFSLIMVLVNHREFSPRYLLAFFMVFAVGIGIEMLGVNTGHIFGVYTYGKTLGPKILGTPVIIGVNWLLLIYCCFYISNLVKIPAIFKPFLGALLMVVYDFFLEPIAIALDMWNWENIAVPIQNYLAWYAISLVMLITWQLLKIRVTNKIAWVMFIVQLGFFISLNAVRLIFGLT